MSSIWRGVIPAITTPFLEDMTVDHVFLAKHCQWLVAMARRAPGALGAPAPSSMAALPRDAPPAPGGLAQG